MKVGDLVRHKQSGGKYTGIITKCDGESSHNLEVWWWVLFLDTTSLCLCKETHLEVINENKWT